MHRITNHLLILVALSVGMSACDKPAPIVESKAAKPSTAEAPAKDQTHFGAAFELSEALPLKDVATKPDEFLGKPVQVSGRITTVCKKKGCWFIIEDKDTPGVRVTMKDYGFFVPKDCDGKGAVVEGTFKKEIVTEKTRKHLAEDEGKDPSTVTGDVEELGLVATGVELKDG